MLVKIGEATEIIDTTINMGFEVLGVGKKGLRSYSGDLRKEKYKWIGLLIF